MAPPKGHPPYNTKGEGGRPKIWTDEVIEREAEALEEWMKIRGNVFLEDFTIERDFDEDYIGEWVKKNDRFRGAVKRFKTRQKSFLMKGGLLKKHEYRFCHGLLYLNHGVNFNVANFPENSSKNSVSWLLDEFDGTSADLVNE